MCKFYTYVYMCIILPPLLHANLKPYLNHYLNHYLNLYLKHHLNHYPQHEKDSHCVATI